MNDGGGRFAADWLALREPVDHRSRAAGLIEPLEAFLLRRHPGSVNIVDLGAGRGSNLRYLSARLHVPARWTLLDRDAALLSDAGQPGVRARDGLRTRVFDLSAPLAPALTGASLVTASALLDLVSNGWIRSLCETCAAERAALLMALTVDGRVVFPDEDPFDRRVMALVAQDQQRDKGLGVALGARASDALGCVLDELGYRATVRTSDWVLEGADGALVRSLIDGWREAAQRQCPQESAAIAAWAMRRARAATAEGGSLRVGHLDVLGLPPDA